AISAADQSRKVTLITKTPELASGNTPHAQGGIIFRGDDDSPEKLKADIMIAGAGHCWEPAVDRLCCEGPGLVKKILIERLHVDFDRNESSTMDLTAEAAHSMPRIVHCRDKTGDVIEQAVVACLESHPGITCLVNHMALDLLTLSHHAKRSIDIYKKPACFGAMVLECNSGEIVPIFAAKTILATGGLGQLYLHTSNPPESHGDGIAMAWRAGARCFNLQYVQFHPTTLYHESGGRFLISESLRGEGAMLVDKDGNEFMTRHHELGSLAPRDVVARGIHHAMLESGHPCVYLDVTHQDAAWLKERFPLIYCQCFSSGIDIAKERIPVVPAAHYSCGGIGVNLDGRTSLKRLYAVGEVACTGVHGANRLASTSLLESLTWGFFAGLDAAETVKSDEYFPQIDPWVLEKEETDPVLISQDWLTIRNTMWNYVGLVRTRPRLLRARTIFRHLQSEIEQFYQKARLTKDVVELRNGIQSAIAVSSAALEARESRGTHFIHG
ncbi:MAG: FAD-binding protein, partial [bacterium]|nr:FAD-binding protein [bacterium]